MGSVLGAAAAVEELALDLHCSHKQPVRRLMNCLLKMMNSAFKRMNSVLNSNDEFGCQGTAMRIFRGNHIVIGTA